MFDITEYIHHIQPKWKESFICLKETIEHSIPDGFELIIQYGMPTYVIPLKKYPLGYLNQSDVPLPFISFAAQKNYISLYHLGLYAKKDILDWFIQEYPKHMETKLNIGKSCIRFTNPSKIPYSLISELVAKISAEEWISIYQKMHT